jgi:6-pyruvoyltetrahydropterin/6-carboxytetrahydropterin synthase
MSYTIKREIGIDAGHRIPTHGSKCAHLHGHRYRVIAEVSANNLHSQGEQSGMVLEFAFLKKVMMDQIDRLCDHGLILFKEDPILDKFTILSPHRLAAEVAEKGYYFKAGHNPPIDMMDMKLLVIPHIPTAENLADFWYHLMQPEVLRESQNNAKLISVEVHETPNCIATYRE